MKGPELRALLHRDRLPLLKSAPGCRVVDEVGIPGGVADVFVCNGELWGYEIKGETDSTRRLASQVGAYNTVFQRITVVTTPKHLFRVVRLVPHWWGLTVVDGGELLDVRRPLESHEWQPAEVLGMLWKPELDALMQHWLPDAKRSRLSGRKMAEALAGVIPYKAIPRTVADTIAVRTDWGRNRVNPA